MKHASLTHVNYSRKSNSFGLKVEFPDLNEYHNLETHITIVLYENNLL